MLIFGPCSRGFLVSLSALCRQSRPSGGARICISVSVQASRKSLSEYQQNLSIWAICPPILIHLVAYFAATLVRAHGPPLTTTNTNTPARSMPSASPSLGHYQSSHPSLHPSSLPLRFLLSSAISASHTPLFYSLFAAPTPIHGTTPLPPPSLPLCRIYFPRSERSFPLAPRLSPITYHLSTVSLSFHDSRTMMRSTMSSVPAASPCCLWGVEPSVQLLFVTVTVLSRSKLSPACQHPYTSYYSCCSMHSRFSEAEDDHHPPLALLYCRNI